MACTNTDQSLSMKMIVLSEPTCTIVEQLPLPVTGSVALAGVISGYSTSVDLAITNTSVG
jgi:uncharacterized protein YpuA (DUF1002 family)